MRSRSSGYSALRFRGAASSFACSIARLDDPDISFGSGYATISLSTKKIKGLHENDFIMATKIDRIFDRSSRSLDRQ